MKKLVFTLALAAFVAGLLQGCGSATTLDDKQGTTYNQTMPANQKATQVARKEKADNLK